ncbi:hypothetical protein [Endozoicomonas sp.]|uniref:hypothetical protein n=1 Tax=Endozoicomonas sp. TaxID=1892382 RepID=UPI0028864F3C|nr:hypothetical protein [Endozoicomonas sp.]
MSYPAGFSLNGSVHDRNVTSSIKMPTSTGDQGLFQGRPTKKRSEYRNIEGDAVNLLNGDKKQSTGDGDAERLRRGKIQEKNVTLVEGSSKKDCQVHFDQQPTSIMNKVTVLESSIKECEIFFGDLNEKGKERFDASGNVRRTISQIRSFVGRFKEDKLPDVFPIFIPERIVGKELLDKLQALEIKFYDVYQKKSSVSLDCRFVESLARFIGKEECIEVYAGNGWLSHELKGKGVAIEASDNFSVGYYKDGTDASFYRREVVVSCAIDSVERFSIKLSKGQKGIVLLGFPEGKFKSLHHVLTTPLRHRNIRVIGIGIGYNINNPEWKKTPEGLNVRNITNEVCYTSCTRNEPVLEYTAADNSCV